MSWSNFLTSLILNHWEIPLEYNLIACLPNAFAVFSPFSFISRCLYSAYVLLIVSSLALSTLSCVHLCPNKCALPLSMTLFKHSRFLCCSMPSFGVPNKYALPLSMTLFKDSCFLCCPMPSFGVSTMSPKESSSFNIF